jgi:hypothetical protein
MPDLRIRLIDLECHLAIKKKFAIREALPPMDTVEPALPSFGLGCGQGYEQALRV